MRNKSIQNTNIQTNTKVQRKLSDASLAAVR